MFSVKPLPEFIEFQNDAEHNPPDLQYKNYLLTKHCALFTIAP